MIIVQIVHADNRKNNFFVLSEGPTDDIKGSIGAAEKKFGINFSKANTKFCLSLHYNHDNSCMFVNGKEILSFKQIIKKFNSPTQFCLARLSNKFDAVESREICFDGNVYGFSVDYNSFSGRCNHLKTGKWFKFLS